MFLPIDMKETVEKKLNDLLMKEQDGGKVLDQPMLAMIVGPVPLLWLMNIGFDLLHLFLLQVHAGLAS